MQVGIIGAGGMGCWFAAHFSKKGSGVMLYDLDPEKSRLGASECGGSCAGSVEEVLACDVILVAVPIKATAKVLENIGNRIEPDKILIEISSVKEDIAEKFRQINCRKVSMHPMFGPSAGSIDSENLLIINDLSSPDAVDYIIRFFDKASLHRCTLSRHEDAMSVVLGLTYSLNEAFFQVAKDVPGHFQGPTFRSQKELAAKVLSEDPGLRLVLKKKSGKKMDEFCRLLLE
jgi:prephenate dehydrogenase